MQDEPILALILATAGQDGVFHGLTRDTLVRKEAIQALVRVISVPSGPIHVCIPAMAGPADTPPEHARTL